MNLSLWLDRYVLMETPDQSFGVDLEARARTDRKRVPIIVTTILTFLDNRMCISLFSYQAALSLENWCRLS